MSYCQDELASWKRLFAQGDKELEFLSKLHGFSQEKNRPGKQDTKITSVRLEGGKVFVGELYWHQEADHLPLLTIEVGRRMIRPVEITERLKAQELPSGSAHAVALMVLHQLLNQNMLVLNKIDEKLSLSMVIIRDFLATVGTNDVKGTTDMGQVDSDLSILQQPLAVVLRSLMDIESAARHMRRLMIREASSLSLHHIEGLIAEIEGVQRRARMMLERQRFHWEAAGDAVAMSDLNVTKVFSVLWAAFVPGTTLINWYGQNFRVMPELSWEGSLWVQLLAVLVLTSLPLWMVKRSGTLR
ncbi:hypothetical protein AAEX37_00515 [Oligella sp. MSHR50489EDL]|uniref:CorA family divalent cation transporter n=1 Tax=Oligella sp. MSHR50489EDL TaxID=3139409 RepID=UPI003D819D08